MALRELFGGNPPPFKLPAVIGPVGYTLQVEPATKTLGWAAPVTPGSGVAVANQADTRLVTCSATNDILEGETTLTYDNGTQTLSVQNLSGLSTINGAAYPPPASQVSVSNQADNRIVTATAVTDSLLAEVNLTFDGAKLGMNNVSNYIVGAANLGNAAFTKCAALGSGTVGNNSVCVGALTYAGNASVVVGSDAGRSGMSGSYNTIVGYFAGRNITSGGGNIIVGGNGGQALTTGSNNVLIGGDTGNTMTNNTVLGSGSNTSDGTTHYSNSTVLGSAIASVISGNNQVQLGNSATTTYVYGTVQTRSDGRDKVDVRDSVLGLDFISQLRPVDFRWDYREDYRESVVDPETREETITILPKDGRKKRSRFHHGLIAQEVKATCDRLGVDFGGYQDHAIAGGSERLTLGYEELIGPLIRSIQELRARVEALEVASSN